MSQRYQKITIVLTTAYFLVVSLFLISRGVWFHPDFFFAAALLVALILGRSKQFIMDWSLPIMLLLGYDYLRGLAPNLTQSAHIYPMIVFDQVIFKSLPTNSLQSLLYSDNSIRWYDYLGTILYMSHFITPMLVGFIFWLKDRSLFRRFFLALLLLSYTAFITYVVFPAMPPWMAAQKGIIPEVFKIMDKVFASLPHSIDLPTVYKMVGANLVAAVPSLHAAYPLLVLLFLVKKYKVWGLFVLPYMLGIWFSIVYLGEHYVFDIVVGALYAVVIFYLVINADKILQKIIVVISKIRRLHYLKI